MEKWKEINPDLKIQMSVGGWEAGSSSFIPMVSSDESRATFCKSVLDVCKTYKLDGIGIY